MDDLIFLVLIAIFQFLIVVGIFVVSRVILKFILTKIESTSRFKESRFFNPQEYLPDEEIISIRQVFYLIMILIFTMNLLYIIFSWREFSLNLLFFDLIISLYLSLNIDRTSRKNKFILFCLIPFGSLAYVLFGISAVVFLDVLHIVIYLYFIRVYFRKFTEFTQTHSLGITIMLLFLLIFVSFFITIIVEDVSPLNSLDMVSNAFTSNGYAVLGKTSLGKLNSIFLVWAGFILSSVGTATLTVSIVMHHVNGEFDRLEELIKKNRK